VVTGEAGKNGHVKKQRTALLITLAILFLGLPSRALAQDPTPPPEREVTDDEVNAIAEQLYCPVCENIPLDVCGTRACADWRDEIRQMLAQGHSEAEIKAYFAGRYGRRVLTDPDPVGFDVLTWVLPPVGVVAGVVVLALALRRSDSRSGAAEAAPEAAVSYDDLDPDYVARLERELEEFAS
jgi:cytochrome c-type biogenesis protein CcmH